jgi:RNA exonuclease 4
VVRVRAPSNKLLLELPSSPPVYNSIAVSFPETLGMELGDLSRNWRKLQESLKQEKTSSLAKRKALDRDSALQQPNTKRTKHIPTSQNPQSTSRSSQRRSMASGNASKPSASLALFAQDNDLPVEDISATYGVSLKSTSLPNEDASRVNEGRSPTYVSML